MQVSYLQNFDLADRLAFETGQRPNLVIDEMNQMVLWN